MRLRGLFLLSFCVLASHSLLHAQNISADSLNRLINQRAAQIVKQRLDSMTAAKAAPATPPAFQYQLMADGTYNQGNVERRLYLFQSSIAYSRGVVSLETNPRYAYGEQNGQIAERDFLSDLNLNLFHDNALYGFGIGIYETSNLRAINHRWYGGGGLGLRIANKPNAKLSITNALIYEETDFYEEIDVFTLRNSTRVKGRYKLWNDKIRIAHLLFYQPSLQDANNLRWSANIALEFPVHRLLSFRTAVNNSYESVVDEGRKNNDFTWTFGFTFGNKH